MNKKQLIEEMAVEIYFADKKSTYTDGRAFYNLPNVEKGYYYTLAKEALKCVLSWMELRDLNNNRKIK